jgi:hypothetical protein
MVSLNRLIYAQIIIAYGAAMSTKVSSDQATCDYAKRFITAYFALRSHITTQLGSSLHMPIAEYATDSATSAICWLQKISNLSFASLK